MGLAGAAASGDSSMVTVSGHHTTGSHQLHQKKTFANIHEAAELRASARQEWMAHLVGGVSWWPSY